MHKNRATALLLLAALAGCAGPQPPPRTTIDISDSGVFVPGARASFDIGHRSEAPSDPHTGHAIEVGASRGSGSDSQTLASSQQPVVFGGRTFSPPQQLSYDFDFTFLEAAYRFRWFFNPDFGIEALGGLAHANLDLTVSAPGQSASEGVDAVGGIVGFGLVWRLWRSGALQARATLFASGDDDGVTNAQRFEVSLLQAVGRNLGLRAGYVYWRGESERDEFSVSPIKFKFSGPVLGLELAF